MSEELMQIVTECIEALEEGRLTLEECLVEYAEYRHELEPLLLVAAELGILPPAMPSLEFREVAAQRLLAKIEADRVAMPEKVLQETRMVVAGALIPLTERLLMLPQALARMWPFSVQALSAVGLSVLAFTLLLVGLLVSSGLSATGNWNRSDLLPEEDRTATIEVLDGSVEVLAPSGEWRSVSKFALLSVGQRVRTGNGARARVTFFDGSAANVGPNMEFTVQRNNSNGVFPALGPSSTPTMTVTPTPTMTTTPTPTMTTTPTPTMDITPTPTPTVGMTPTPTPGQEFVTICHKPGTPAEQTKVIPAPALNGHLGHGDTMGPCANNTPTATPPGATSTATPPGQTPTPTPEDGGVVTICHKPGTPAQQTMTVPQSALQGHLNHGDTIGACQ